MKTAILAVRAKEIGLLHAPKYSNVHKSTLKFKVNTGEGQINKLVSITLSRQPALRGEN